MMVNCAMSILLTTLPLRLTGTMPMSSDDLESDRWKRRAGSHRISLSEDRSERK